MERVFLSYTYNPHPEYAADNNALQLATRRMLEAMNVRVEDGMDIGGRALEAEIERRILSSDGFIALYAPQEGPDGAKVLPQYVCTEFDFARAREKCTIRVIFDGLPIVGLGAAEERVNYIPGTTAQMDIMLKLMRTVARWKSDLGRSAMLMVEPQRLAEEFDINRGDSCGYELMIANNTTGMRQTNIIPEPGCAYVHIPNLVDGAKVRVRLIINGKRWQSPFVLPQLGGLLLKES